MKDFFFSNENTQTNHQTNLLEEILKDGARRLLQQAIENEVKEYIASHKTGFCDKPSSSIIRNGYLPERSIQTGLGDISIRQPRVRHKDGGKFTSALSNLK